MDHAFGDRHDRLEQAALACDRVAQRQALAGQRVAPARVRIALEQHVVARVEEDQAVLDAAAGQAGENFRQPVQILGAIAHVDADGKARMKTGLRLGHGIDERRHQRAGQVVDAVVVEILQRAQRYGLAGAGHAADDDQARCGILRSGAFPGWSHARGYQGGWRRIWCACRSRKVCAGSMPLVFSTWLRTAASTSTARLRPGATGIVVCGTLVSRTSR